MLLELGVGLGEAVVGRAFSDEDDLHVERNRLGGERHGAALRDEDLVGDLHPHFARPKRTLELVPRVRRLDELLGVDEQVAAVRTVEGACFDEREVGRERAQPGDVLDASEEARDGRMILDDDRRARRATVLDDHVNPIPREHAPVGISGAALALWRSRGDRVGELLEEIRVDAVEERDDLRKVTEALADVGDVVIDDASHRLAVEAARRVAHLLLPARHLVEERLDVRRDLFHRAVERVLLGRRERVRLGVREHGPVLHRLELETGLGFLEREGARRGHLRDRFDGFLAAFLERRLNRLAPRAVLLALEGGGHRDSELVGELLHRVAERYRAPLRDAKEVRRPRILEAVDVTDVVRRRVGLRPP